MEYFEDAFQWKMFARIFELHPLQLPFNRRAVHLPLGRVVMGLG